MKMRINTLSIFIIGVLSLLSWSGTSIASINLGLSGFGTNNNAGLESYTRKSGTLSLSVGLINHLRIGLSTRTQKENRKGIKYHSNLEVYFPFKSSLEEETYTVNLTIVLYNGPISPYIFGGLSNKYYNTKFTYDFDEPIVSTRKFELTNVPTYGFGIAFFINKDFSLKASQTFSEGKSITLTPEGEENAKVAQDYYTQVGISYAIR